MGLARQYRILTAVSFTMTR